MVRNHVVATGATWSRTSIRELDSKPLSKDDIAYVGRICTEIMLSEDEKHISFHKLMSTLFPAHRRAHIWVGQKPLLRREVAKPAYIQRKTVR